MLISPDRYNKSFLNFRVTDCAVRNRNIFYFVAKKYFESDADFDDEDENLTRVIVCFLDMPIEKRWSMGTYSGFNDLIAGATAFPMEQFIGVDGDGKVISMGSGIREFENEIPHAKEGPQRGGIRKTKTINGYLHFCSGNSGLGYRKAKDEWVSLCQDIPPKGGFEDFDAFKNGEMYAVGGNGYVMHLKNEKWVKCKFPKDWSHQSKLFDIDHTPMGHDLTAVCCGEDGYVYIGTEHGAIFKGKEDEWAQLKAPNFYSRQEVRDLVWHKDRVYGSDGSSLYEIVNGNLREAEVDSGVRACCHNLYVNDGVLLAASEIGAAYNDGTSWKILFRKDPWEDKLASE